MGLGLQVADGTKEVKGGKCHLSLKGPKESQEAGDRSRISKNRMSITPHPIRGKFLFRT